MGDYSGLYEVDMGGSISGPGTVPPVPYEGNVLYVQYCRGKFCIVYNTGTLD
jgi:hypothetical protein